MYVDSCSRKNFSVSCKIQAEVFALIILLNDKWRARPDPERRGEREHWDLAGTLHDDWHDASVPSCWNTCTGYERYEGLFWYATEFELPVDASLDNHEVYIEFDAVNYLCRAWFNGHFIGEHEGGYLPFAFPAPKDDVTQNNRLVVLVDNRRSAQRIPGEVFDWFNYGGIVRDVRFRLRRARRFESVRVSAVPAPGKAANVIINYQQRSRFPFSWIIEDSGRILAQGHISGKQLNGHYEIELARAETWSPGNPKLYTLRLEPGPLAAAEAFSTKFGVRSIETRGTEILLNGNPIKIKGVSLHEEQIPFGRCIPREQRYQDVRDIKALGFNALRTAHYTHDAALLDAADEIGLLMFEEIPVYWEIDYANADVYKKAESMVEDMIARDFNHPSVMHWSVANEIPVERPECDRFVRRLMEHARSLDPTRMVSYVSCRFLIDKTRAASDVACVNCYLGWYYGNEHDMPGVMALARDTAPGKPWIMAEFGACARSGYHSARHAKYSEDKQEKMIAYYIRSLNSMPWVAGWFIWLYRDFRSPLRTHRHQRGFNRKGMVSETNIQKSICRRFPGLIHETRPLRDVSPPGFVSAAVEQIEAMLYKLIMPRLYKSQKEMFDDYYSNRPGTSE